MKKFLFAVAVVCLFAASTPAADQPVTPTAPAPGTVVTSGTTVYSTTGATSTRRMGLFSRLRNRSSSAAYSTVPTTVMTPATPMPGTTVPTPMPKPSTGATTGGTGVVTAGGTTVVDGKVVETMVMPMTTTTRTGRMGLFSRLRNRTSSSAYSTVPTTVMTPATPMPGTTVPKPSTGASTGGTGVVTAGGTTVVDGTTMMMPTTTTMKPARTGIIARMRMRMAN